MREKRGHASSFRPEQFWKRCCRRCGRWSRRHWRNTYYEEYHRKIKALRRSLGNRRPFSFPEGRTYSPPARGRRWYPSRWSGTRALRGGFRFLRKATDDATALASAAVTVCAACHIAPNRRYGMLPATNLPPAALSQRWTALPPCPFSLLRKRNRKRG